MVAVLRLGSAASLCLILAVGVALYERQLAWTVERKAALGATAWLEYFSATVPDFESLLRTGEVTAPQLDALRTAKAALDVFRFKLFDAEGRLTFLSDMIDGVSSGGEALFRHNPEAAAALESGDAFVGLEDGTGEADRPDRYAEVYLPVIGQGGPLGIVEVYVDMTTTWDVTRAAFARFALLLGGLGLAALAVPTMHWLAAWRETRRRNDELRDKVRRESHLTREVRLIGELNEWLQSSRSQSELFEMVVGFLTRLLPACAGEIYVYANSRDVLDGSAGWAGRTPHDHIHPEDCWSLRRGRTYA